jgi:translation initiation factor IF-3
VKASRAARPDFFNNRRKAIAQILRDRGRETRPHRLNAEITAPEVRLVGDEGEQHGVVPIREALRLAEEQDVDLVEIAPLAEPPVCKLMDYGKFKYREQKKAHEAKLKQKQIQVKEVKFRPRTEEGDYKIKLRNLVRFLEEGDKTKVTLRFRGREMAHQEFGYRLLERVKADLESYGAVEQWPKLEGRQMVMVLAPKKVAPTKEAKPKAPKAPKEPKAAKDTKADATEEKSPAASGEETAS